MTPASDSVLPSAPGEPVPEPAPAESEVWTVVPPDPPEAVRALSAEERWPGEWHAVAWMYAHGTSQKEIARELDYSEARISVILQKPAVHDKIERIRREFLGTESLTKKFSAVAPHAADYLTKVIDGKEGAKVRERMQASIWTLEKLTGKPKQEGLTDGGTTILQLLQALAAAAEAKAAPGGRAVAESPDIELRQEKPRDALAEWVAQNVPDGTGEKK